MLNDKLITKAQRVITSGVARDFRSACRVLGHRGGNVAARVRARRRENERKAATAWYNQD